MPSNLLALLARILPADSSILEAWSHQEADISPLAYEDTVVETARHLILRCYAQARVAEHDAVFAPPGAELDMFQLRENLNALNIVLASCPLAGRHLMNSLGDLNGACQLIASNCSKILLRKTLSGETLDVSDSDVIWLPLLILLRVVGSDRVGALEVLELSNNDIAIATLAITYVLLRTAHDEAPPGASLAMARALRALASSTVSTEMLHRAGVEDTAVCSMEDLHSWQVSHCQNVTLAFIQFNVVPSIAGAALETMKYEVFASVISALRALVAHPMLSGTARLLGRHLAAHAPIFAHRLLAISLRHLLTIADHDDTNGEVASRHLREHVRTIRWLLFHAEELRAPLQPLCCEVVLRWFHSTKADVSVGATLIATAACAGSITERVVDAFATFDAQTRLEFHTALVQESRTAPLSDDALERLVELQLCDLASIRAAFAESAIGTFPTNEQVIDNVANCILGDADLACESDLATPGVVAMGPCAFPEIAQSPGTTTTKNVMQLIRDAPAELRCAIDGRLCCEPCRSPAGALFEHRTVDAWLKHMPVCPILGVPMTRSELVEDSETSLAVDAWLAAQQ